MPIVLTRQHALTTDVVIVSLCVAGAGAQVSGEAAR